MAKIVVIKTFDKSSYHENKYMNNIPSKHFEPNKNVNLRYVELIHVVISYPTSNLILLLQ